MYFNIFNIIRNNFLTERLKLSHFRQNRDKNIERKRYDLNSKSIELINLRKLDVLAIPKPLREPYKRYELIAKKKVFKGARVLEIAAGKGQNTKIFLDNKAHVIATDVSLKSLEVLKKIFNICNILYPLIKPNNPYIRNDL